MTLEDVKFGNLKEIKENYEKFFNETQANLRILKNEHNQLRTHILNIIAENTSINIKLEAEKRMQATINATGESKDDATREQLTNDALKNLKKLIGFLQAENHELRSLHQSAQKTIHCLETEVRNYRQEVFQPASIEEIKQKYITAIKLLETTIKTQKTEILQQTKMMEDILSQKNQFGKQIESLEVKLLEKDRELDGRHCGSNIEKLHAKIAELTQQNQDLEKSLKVSKQAIEERFERERCALQKVQEALAIAETAVNDKEVAQRLEQVAKEECENLASTIGEVMDEAARKVEKDMQSLRGKFLDKNCVLTKAQEKLKNDLENQGKYSQILETRCIRYEQKFRDTLKEKESLLKELQVTKASLDELHLELQANEGLLAEYQMAKKHSEDQEQKIQHYLQTNNQLKEKYKAAVEDIASRFEKAIFKLQIENANLRVENRVIKVKKGVSSDCD